MTDILFRLSYREKDILNLLRERGGIDDFEIMKGYPDTEACKMLKSLDRMESMGVVERQKDSSQKMRWMVTDEALQELIDREEMSRKFDEQSFPVFLLKVMFWPFIALFYSKG